MYLAPRRWQLLDGKAGKEPLRCLSRCRLLCSCDELQGLAFVCSAPSLPPAGGVPVLCFVRPLIGSFARFGFLVNVTDTDRFVSQTVCYVDK